MNRYLLYFIVFITGAIVMFLELIGTRIISPYYGNTIYTWTALMSIALLFLSAGNYFGGRLSDKKPDKIFLFLVLFFVGILLILIGKLRHIILPLTNVLGLKLGTMASAMVLFALPFLLLGTIIPFVIKSCANDLKTLGITSGKIYALSTLGSFFGVIVTGFYLIPNLPITPLLMSAGIFLVVLSMGKFISSRYKWLLIFSIVILIPVTADDDSIYSGQGYYGSINVVDKENLRFMLVDGSTQSCIYKDSGKSCYYYLQDIKNFIEPDSEVLLVGLGAGMMGRKMNLTEVVEIDPKIVEVARDYFRFGDDVIIDDGRHFIRNTDKLYDVIVLDAFSSYTIPLHLLSREAFQETKNKLNVDGMVILNTLGNTKEDLQKSIYSTLNEVFPYVYVRELGTEFSNIIFFASMQPLEGNFVQMEEGIVITDDYNPTEIMHLHLIEEWHYANGDWLERYVI